MKFTFKLSKLLKAKILGNDRIVFGLASYIHPKKNYLIPLNNFSKKIKISGKIKQHYQHALKHGNCFLVNHEDYKLINSYIDNEKSYLLSKNFKLDFITLLNTFNPYLDHPNLNILSNNNFEFKVGPNCIAGDKVEIGEGSKLYSGIYLGENVKLGKNVIIYPNVVIHSGTKIGDNVIIHSGVVIGDDGFGYESTSKGSVKIPQIGKVIIGNDVEIGANCCIDRGTIDDTIIGDRVKIDNLVQIAHNVEIGNDSIIISQVGIAGSSILGKRVILAGQVGVSDHVVIEDNVQVGAQSGIMPGKIIPANSMIFGSPAIPYREKMKMEIALKKLI